jgi:hypothetical protein
MRYDMIDPKQHIGTVLLVCLAFSFLLSYAGPTHPAKPSRAPVNHNLGHIPSEVPLLLPARSQVTPFDRLGCRLACEKIGFWDMEQEIAHRLVNACMIGCNLGQDHCL